MSGNRWGSEGPPPEAYSRVTNPERFRPLHDVALELLGRLEATFNVERLEGYGLDQEQEKRSDLARSSVKLIPRNPDAAPMVVVFTAFPGLLVRLGQWREEAFPSCGCDACDETADDEATRLAKMVDNVTAGRFREAIGLPLIGLRGRNRNSGRRRNRNSGCRGGVPQVASALTVPALGRCCVQVTGRRSRGGVSQVVSALTVPALGRCCVQVTGRRSSGSRGYGTRRLLVQMPFSNTMQVTAEAVLLPMWRNWPIQ